MKDFLRAQRKKLEIELEDTPRRWFFSPVAYSQYKVTLPLVVQYAVGDLIDLGCGDMPFRPDIAGQITHYDGLDIAPRSPHTELKFVADIQDMPMVPTASYDTALCIEVLEHVPDPCRALGEIYRILKPGGRLIVSVPHLSRLHEEPHDYYRYTAHGLRALAKRANLDVLRLVVRGGVFSFLGHQLSTVFLGLVWSWPVIGRLAWVLNSWFFTRGCFWLDTRLSDLSAIFPLGYTLVAEKPTASQN